MRSLKKNMQKLHYSLYSKQIMIYEKDENGNIIYDEIDGEVLPRIIAERAGYSEPVSFYANISAANGTSDSEVFGVSLDYTKTISTSDMTLPISETSLIWFETEPTYNDDGTVNEASADYSVVAVARSLNNVVYAIKKLAKEG
ncbi:MAG TPA: hypothetical protein H9742_14145 [Candidatus Acetatifactor stercoripullorum]|uniref:Uncharacterized protein n=1 Tax=Candidatus Acetatifactor stercoripullorum TaxID=2838414 RepID=A0A9D1R7S9_9FIRM|nr:hypothetical protein [Candidatus Acetatifactor stercoripullorum]